MPRVPPSLYWTGLWLAVMAAALATRPPLPVDETRYLSVAWDMWLEGHFLVPHLNDEPYSHKPPLLFWLINAGWAVFGVNDWWPRLVAPLFGLMSLCLTSTLARALWPGRDDIAALAPLVLFGGLFWALFTTLTMFDMLLALTTLVALLGLVRAWRGRAWGFVVFGLGIGLGVLAKGPAILVHVLPAALTAPWWGRGLACSEGAGERRALPWLGGVVFGLVLGAAVGLAWAVPAGEAGGAAYREAIFWGQSAGRMVESFAHQEPWWWYGAALPVMALPWLVWPPAWRAVSGLGRAWADGGVRLGVVWFVAAVAVFSAISGKQFHYLLPELPALALVLARLLTAEGQRPRAFDQVMPGVALALVGAMIAAKPLITLSPDAADRLTGLEPAWGWLLVVAGAATALTGAWPLMRRVGALAAMAAAFVVVLHLALGPVLEASYDLRLPAKRLAQWEKDGVAIAHFGKYHGQYHFLGRLAKPFAVIGLEAGDEARFLAQHPTGKIIATHEALPKAAAPEAVFRFRTRIIAIWDAETVRRHPGIAER